MRSEKSLKSVENFDFPRIRPILKWVGGKQQLLPQLIPAVPPHYNKYIEPFLGGGALFFALAPKGAIISDSNPEIINVYRCTANSPEELISLLGTFKTDKETYYLIRSWDLSNKSDIERAARILYLNRLCFNGLYRVNRKGIFNVPYGRYKNPKVCFPNELRIASRLLKSCTICCGDYKEILSIYAEKGDFIFIDPPYLPISKYSDFKRYTPNQFHESDHIELAEKVKALHKKGCHILVTHSNHPLISELYKDFKIHVFQTRRNINKNPELRKGVDVMISIPPTKNNKIGYLQ